MANYTPCDGSGQPATDVRMMRPTDARFMHLHGKNAGKCSDCGKSATLGRGVTVMPRHKAADVRGCSCGEADYGTPGHDGGPQA